MISIDPLPQKGVVLLSITMLGHTYRTGERIAALATPWGESALAVIRTSGQGTVEAMVPLFSSAASLKKAPGHTLLHGHLIDPRTSTRLDEVVLSLFRAPASYTGEECVEISCHGSPSGIKAILDLLLAHGFRGASPGEFTFRAFINGKMDLAEAEAVQEVIGAKTSCAHSLALGRLSGKISTEIEAIRDRLLTLASALELRLDYPDEEGNPPDWSQLHLVRKKILALVGSFKKGTIYQEGVRVVLAGRTNVGKSALFNLFLKEERAIVSASHGTTRDYLCAWINVEGIPVNLFDTAGLRETSDLIEEEGVRRSRSLTEGAHLTLYLFDALEGKHEEDLAFVRALSPLCVWNKIDAPGAKPSPSGFFPISAKSGEGFAALEQALVKRILGESVLLGGEPVIDSLRQKDLLEACLASLSRLQEGIQGGMPSDLLAVDLREALLRLGEVTGSSVAVTEEVLSRLFSQFCVGK